MRIFEASQSGTRFVKLVRADPHIVAELVRLEKANQPYEK
jgi:hypothetical protein